MVVADPMLEMIWVTVVLYSIIAVVTSFVVLLHLKDISDRGYDPLERQDGERGITRCCRVVCGVILSPFTLAVVVFWWSVSVLNE